MATTRDGSADAWGLIRGQHGVITHRQLLDRGHTRAAIRHRVAIGRLHPKTRWVYAVGRPDLTWHGELMVALLACGASAAVISHESAAALLELRPTRLCVVEVTLTDSRRCRVPGVRAHGRSTLGPRDIGRMHSIPVTSPARTLVDNAPSWTQAELERSVNIADSLDLIDPETLRRECERFAGQPGVAKLRALLDRRTFRATDSRLEQRFLAIVRETSLGLPVTQRHVDGTGPTSSDLGLVVETDSLRYHRTPSQQYRDRLRDQAHFAAGRTPLRFTHAQVFYEEPHVRGMLGKDELRLTGQCERD